jgi:O-antigen/teichoic acid export membrane protein
MTAHKAAVLKGSAIVIDQGIVSGSRFFIVLLLARYVSPTEYGGFVMAYGILMLMSYLQTAYILVPMSVFGPSLAGEEQKLYYGTLLKLQIVLSLVISLCIMLTARIWSLWFNEPILLYIFLVMGISVFCSQLQEFFRRLFYNNFEVGKAISNDIACYLSQLIGILILIWNKQLSSTAIFWLISGASLLSGCWAFFQCHSSFTLKKNKYKETLSKQWGYGKWLLASMMAQWISGQIYVYFSASFLSLSAAGVMGACRNIFGIVNVALTGLRNFILPYGSKQYSVYGKSFLKGFVRKIYILGSAGIFILCFTGALFASDILELLYRGQYRGFNHVLILVAVLTFVSFYVFPPDTGLLLLRRVEGIFGSNLIASAGSLLIAIPLIRSFGLDGALWGMIVTQLVLVVSITRMFRIETAKVS